MGDAADMILDGIIDEQTGEYIGEGVGYPRTMQREPDAKFGVLNFLRKKGHSKKYQQTLIIESYLKSIDVKVDNLSKDEMCQLISNDFGKFVKYCNKK